MGAESAPTVEPPASKRGVAKLRRIPCTAAHPHGREWGGRQTPEGGDSRRPLPRPFRDPHLARWNVDAALGSGADLDAFIAWPRPELAAHDQPRTPDAGRRTRQSFATTSGGPGSRPAMGCSRAWPGCWSRNGTHSPGSRPAPGRMRPWVGVGNRLGRPRWTPISQLGRTGV